MFLLGSYTLSGKGKRLKVDLAKEQRSSRSLYINPWDFSFSDVSRVWIKMFFCQEMNSHFWHFCVFYYRALVLILQYTLHFYLKRGTNNNLLFCECDFERFGFYAHMLYGFAFDGWNDTYFKKLLYMLCFLPLVSYIYEIYKYMYIFLLKECIAEVQSWRQYFVKIGFNPLECSKHYIRDLSFYGAVSPVKRIYGSRIEK